MAYGMPARRMIVDRILAVEVEWRFNGWRMEVSAVEVRTRE